MNATRVAAALRALADAIETPADTADLPPAQSAAAAAPPKRGRGRPVTGETSTAQTAPPAATEAADPFETPAPQATTPAATLDEVRAALKALAAATSQDNALKVLKDISGVTNLTDLQKTPEKYGAVKLAAEKATPVKTAEPEQSDPFETPAAPAAAAEAAPDLAAVKAALVAAQKRTAVDTVQKVVMKHGGVSAVAGGPAGVSLTNLPVSAYAAVIKEVQALPTTK